MCICNGCGKLIDSKFFYCPWCGASKVKNDTVEAIELQVQQYKQKKQDDRIQLIQKMEEELNSLEKELSVLILSHAMAE